MKHFILGGVRSGKSRVAEQHALASSSAVTYIATAQCFDASMEARINLHRQRRVASWVVEEIPFHLSQSIRLLSSADNVLLVDCVSMWLTNWLLAEQASEWITEREAFFEALTTTTSPIILVSNEVGFGGISANPLARQFADELGLLNQEIAAICHTVELVVAGQRLKIKGE